MNNWDQLLTLLIASRLWLAVLIGGIVAIVLRSLRLAERHMELEVSDWEQHARELERRAMRIELDQEWLNTERLQRRRQLYQLAANARHTHWIPK